MARARRMPDGSDFDAGGRGGAKRFRAGRMTRGCAPASAVGRRCERGGWGYNIMSMGM